MHPPPLSLVRIRSAALVGLSLLSAALFLTGTARADKGITEGTYRDREGKTHHWNILRGHALEWEDKLYAPAGLVFRSAYLNAPSDATLAQDISELDRLKSAGVQDIWIEPQRGLLQNRPEQIQAIVDAVEARGFRYGLRVGDRHREPLIGFSPTMSPIKVPVSRIQPGARVGYDVAAPGCRRVAYTLADVGTDERIQNYAIATGEALVEGRFARIDIHLPRSKLLGKSRGLLLVVPEVQVDPDQLGSFGDLWAGMSAYSERLAAQFKRVRFGPGLRFILDPFSAGDGTVGQEDMVFPTSESFRDAFKTWILRRIGPATVNIRWRLTDRRPATPEEVARLVPTWPRSDPPEGDGWLIDPVDHVGYRCIPRECRIWDDLDAFRADSLKRRMNQITDTLRKEGPDVPMLFTWSSYHPIFTNSPSPSGYDGLAAQLYGAPDTIAKASAAYAFAQAEEADRNTWLVAARLAGPRDKDDNPTPLADTGEARRLWDAVREVGFRGVYLDPAQVKDAVSAVKELGSSIASSEADLRRKIPVCFFPMAFAGADRVTRLSNGVWWLPSSSDARMLRYGDNLIGYEIEHPFGSDHRVRKGTVIWSPKGAQEMTFPYDKLTKAEFYTSAGEPLKVKIRKKEMQVTIGEEPIVGTELESTGLFPLELARSALKEYADLLSQAEAQRQDVTALRILYKQANDHLSTGSAPAVYSSIMPNIRQLRLMLMPYVWLEGERSLVHNFSGVAFEAGASQGTYLKLDRRDKPVSGVYRARYIVDLARDATYEIWVAGRVPGRPGVSPLIWQVDEEPPAELPKAEATGQDYAPGMAWYQLGRMTLKAGRHELTLVVPDRAGGEQGRYVAGFDAIVFSRTPFNPNGVEKPVGKASPRAEK